MSMQDENTNDERYATNKYTRKGREKLKKMRHTQKKEHMYTLRMISIKEKTIHITDDYKKKG